MATTSSPTDHPLDTADDALPSQPSCSTSLINIGEGKLTCDQSLLDACIHCGLCLPHCPTYLATAKETESPRGRIYLINLWASGTQQLSNRLTEHLESCLGCLGCQSACPSGVQYEELLSESRPHLAKRRDRYSRRLLRFVCQKVLPDYKKLRSLGKMLRLWQILGGPKLMVVAPWLGKLAARLNRWHSFLPPVPKFSRLPRQSWVSGEKTGQVQLFSGCVMDILYNHVNHASIRMLTAQKRIVSVPEQTCCGALAYHSGEIDIAQQLAKQNIELFEQTTGAIVVTASGCTAMLKQYGELLADDAEWAGRAKAFSQRVVDIVEALDAGQFAKKPEQLARKVTYHASCHLAHAQGVRSAPERLLRGIEGLSLIPLENAEHCCGSAGIFNLTHTELSEQILKDKVRSIADTGAEMVVTTNPGCLLQISSGIRAAGLPVEVKHIVELLDEVY